MKTYLRMQLALEHHKEFPIQDIRSAMSTTLTRLSREDEESSAGPTLNHVFEALMWTWRRVMANAHQIQDGVPPEVNEATKNERALIVCTAQIVAEKAAKHGPSKGTVQTRPRRLRRRAGLSLSGRSWPI